VTVDIATGPRPLTRPADGPMAVLNNAFGFGGHNVSLAFTEYAGAPEEG
jgi:3-oxoacyl-[acyl-carrier-protein] synthase II